MDVGLYPSPDSVIYVNGLEAASDSGYVDTSSAATGTQWSLVRSLQTSMYVSYNNYLDTLINPASGSMMLALNDVDTTNGDTGYVNNSYSIWHALRLRNNRQSPMVNEHIFWALEQHQKKSN